MQKRRRRAEEKELGAEHVWMVSLSEGIVVAMTGAQGGGGGGGLIRVSLLRPEEIRGRGKAKTAWAGLPGLWIRAVGTSCAAVCCCKLRYEYYTA